MRMDKPTVSIVTPTYNRARFLCEAIASVAEQTYTNFEHIIVDDGSTDDTQSVLEPFLKDSRFRYFYQENQGQSVARNLGLKHARGDFICFLDSDNTWMPDKLMSQISILEKSPDIDVVYGDCITINEEGKVISYENMKRYSGLIAFQMLKDNCVSMNTAMARRKCFDEMGGMSGKRRVADDYDLWLRFAAFYQFHYVPEYFACYRVMENQISSDKSGRFESNETIIHDFRVQFPDVLAASKFNEAFAYFYARKARYLASTGDRRGALRTIMTAVRYRPFYRAPWRSLLAILLRRFG